MTDKRDFLFRFVPQTIRRQVLMDDEAMYSTTDQVTARKLCDELSKFIPQTSTVVDATACIGGLTYSLTNVFRYVIAVEIDHTRHEYLKTNMDLLGVNSMVNCIHGDAMQVCVGLDATAIVIDPPWGGPEYKNIPNLSLKLGNLDLVDACVILYQNNPSVNIIAIKVPTNFDDTSLTCSMFAIVRKSRLRKMDIIIVQRNAV